MSDPTQLPPFPGPPFVGPPLPSPAGGNDTPPTFQYQVLPDLTPPATPVVVVSTPYDEYAINKIVFTCSGQKAQAVGGAPGTKADVITESAPWGKMVVRWYSRCRGGAPKIPSRDLQDGNTLFTHGWVGGSGPGFFTDGTKAEQREGCYFYDLLLPYMETDTIVIAAFPFTNEAAADNTISPDDYSKDIIGPNEPPEGA